VLYIKAEIYKIYDSRDKNNPDVGINQELMNLQEKLKKFKEEIDTILKEKEFPLLAKMEEDVNLLLCDIKNSSAYKYISYYCLNSEAKIVKSVHVRKKEDDPEWHGFNIKKEELRG
jgi:nucleoside-triphosphatase THEP1